MLQPCNLIIMDEPTNHLDMRSKAVMQQALLNFEGSYVIVSHDRDFLDPIVNKVVEFSSVRSPSDKGSPPNGEAKIKRYLGNVSEYIYAKQKEQSTTQAASVVVQQQKKKVQDSSRREEPPKVEDSTRRESIRTKLSDKERKRLEAEQRQKRSHLTKPIQQNIYNLEREIESKEKQKAEFEELMGHADFYKDGERVKEVTAQYKALESALADIYFKWGELTKELEKVHVEFKN
jgi:ATP-binding cassette subfamily F protein 3